MFKKDQRFNQPFPGGMQPPGMQPQGLFPPGLPGQGMFPQLQGERLRIEILENRRRLNNLARRVSRIENYLRIQERPDYGYYEDEKPNNYSF